MEQDTWADRLTAQIGQNIKQCRELQSFSAEQVSARAAEVGMNISRQMITNLETGRRASLSVAELAVIAEALGVEPVSLIYPPTDLAKRVEYLPGKTLEAIEAHGWFSALLPLLRDHGTSPRTDAAEAYHFYREALNVDFEIEALDREIARARPDSRELLEMRMRGELHMAIFLRRNIPAGYVLPEPSRLIKVLWTQYFTYSEFMEAAGEGFLKNPDVVDPGVFRS